MSRPPASPATDPSPPPGMSFEKPPAPEADSRAERRGSRWLWFGCALIALCLLLPHAYSSPFAKRAGPYGLARVYSGDEPHYLVLITSLVRDADLDLANNYRNVHRGADDAGHYLRGQALDHHTAWRWNGKLVKWPMVYELEHWDRDRRQRPVPKLREGMPASAAPEREYSSHWPGLAFLLAPGLWLLRDTIYLEPAALLCAWLCTLGTLFGFVTLARRWGASVGATLVAAAFTFLGTPLWHYARTLFTEPFACAFLFGAYVCFFTKRSVWLVGLACAVCVLLKLTYVVMVLPLGVALLLRRDWRQLVGFGLPLALAAALTLLLNRLLFGSALQTPQPWESGDVLSGSYQVLFSLEHGLLPFAPVLLCALLGWPKLLRERRQEALLALAACGAMYLLMSAYGPWHGGFCFGPRFFVPCLPLLMLGLLPRLRAPLRVRHYADIVLIGALSLWINFRGAAPYWQFYARHPLVSVNVSEAGSQTP